MRVTCFDRGATTAITALFLSAALGFGALVIDVGNSWQERRHLVTATDAAALGAVQDYVRGDNGCTLSAGALVLANNSDATMSDCDHKPISQTTPGWVTVEAEANVNFLFAGALGFSDTDVSSSTTARYDFASTVDGGLRPFGLCSEYLDFIGAEPVGTFVIEYGKDDQPDACGEDAAGNWGELDFNGGQNSNSEAKDWVQNGYDGEVSIGDVIEGNTGNSVGNDLKTELDFLKTVDHFTLPVFDFVSEDPGANAEFTIVDFAVVRLIDWEAGGAKNGTLTLEFLDEVVQGGGGGPGGFGAYVIGICAVDGVDIATACS